VIPAVCNSLVCQNAVSPRLKVRHLYTETPRSESDPHIQLLDSSRRPKFVCCLSYSHCMVHTAVRDCLTR